MSPITAVLFDVDGTLVDSNEAHARAWMETFHARGVPAEYADVRRLVGMGGDRLVPLVAGVAPDSAFGERLMEERWQRFRFEMLPRLRPFPRARDLVVRARAEGLRVAVATAAKEDEIVALLDVCNVRPLMHAIVDSDDVARSKPEGDVVAVALARLGVRHDEAVLIGDTPWDVLAGKRAGVRTVALRSGGWDDEALAGAVAIYDDAADLLARWERSIFAERDRAASWLSG